MTRLLLVLLLAAFAFSQSGDDTDRDDPNPEWPGQKMACNNYRSNAHKCQCALATSCDAHKQKDPYLGGEGDDTEQAMATRCKTYCRRDHCHCISPCAT